MVFVTTDFESIRPFMTLYYDPTQDGPISKKGSGSRDKVTQQPRRPFPIDVKETATYYMIYADLPGYAKEHVSINFDDGERALHILAKRNTTTAVTGDQSPARAESPASTVGSACVTAPEKERWLRRERLDINAAECERYVELPADAVAEEAHASLTDGVLQVKIPRQLPKRYQIQLS